MDEKSKKTKTVLKKHNDLTPIFDLNELKNSDTEIESEPKIEFTESKPFQTLSTDQLPTVTEIISPTIQDVTHLNSIKEFADNIKIGDTITEANPAYSLFAEVNNNEHKKKMIIGIITQEKLQITPQDLEVQLENGKLLIPQISEYTAIYLAMKLRDVVENIHIGPSNLIFESKTLNEENNKKTNLNSTLYIESEQLDSEFKIDTPNDIITSNSSELSGFKIESIISAISTSKIINNPEEFDSASEEIRAELCKKAFRLKANGLIAISFTLKTIPASDQSLVIGSATAVLLRKL